MLKKIDAWETEDGKLHRCELVALDHATRRVLRELVSGAYVPAEFPSDQNHPEAIVRLLMRKLDEIRKIAITHSTERSRIIGERGSKP